jgi:hypothetical protein
MRRLVGLSLCALLGTLTVLLSGGEARAFGPHLVRPHGTWHHRGAVPVQPVTPGQIITGIQIAQGVIEFIRDRREGADAERDPVISPEVFESLDRNQKTLEAVVNDTNALAELVAKNDKRFKDKFKKIDHGAVATKPAPKAGVGTKKAPGM